MEKARRDAAARAAGGGGGAAAAADGSGEGSGGGGDGGGRPSGLCVVCLERETDTVFPACGHMCACSRCSAALRRCPICRSSGRPIRVYAT